MTRERVLTLADSSLGISAAGADAKVFRLSIGADLAIGASTAFVTLEGAAGDKDEMGAAVGIRHVW